MSGRTSTLRWVLSAAAIWTSGRCGAGFGPGSSPAAGRAGFRCGEAGSAPAAPAESSSRNVSPRMRIFCSSPANGFPSWWTTVSSASKGRLPSVGESSLPGITTSVSGEAYGSTNESRMLSMSFEGSRGGFWSGRRTRYAGSVVVKTGPHLTVGSRIARNRVSLPVADGDFTTTLVAFDITGAVSRKLFRRRARAVGQPLAGTPGEHPGGLDPHSGERPLRGPRHWGTSPTTPSTRGSTPGHGVPQSPS